jgi:hypothetical protein
MRHALMVMGLLTILGLGATAQQQADTSNKAQVVTSVVLLSRREIVRRPRRRQATPLRSVPCGLAGLTAHRLRRRSSNYVMATDRLRTRSAVEIERCTMHRERGVMIRSREKRNRRPRRGTRRDAPRDHRDEQLRVFVRTLARQAAREAFARELARQTKDRPEVTVQ